MTWYLFVFLAVIAESLETIIDRLLVMNKEKSLDPLVASFYRNIAFFFFVIIAGVFGLLGDLEFFIRWPIVVLGVICIFNSLAYDYLLRHAEVSRFVGVSYIFSILVIFADTSLFGDSFSFLQILAILLLLSGAFILSTSRKGLKFSSVFSLKAWFFILVKFLIFISTYIVFKWYYIHEGFNEVSYYFSTWVFVTINYLIVLIVSKKYKLLIDTARKDKFLLKTLVSKFFDFSGSILSLKAITLTTISAVRALSSILPLVVFILGFIIQKNGFSMKEEFTNKVFRSKLMAILLIILGSILIINS